MIASECHIRMQDHRVYVRIMQDRVVCFKYDLIRCDIEIFDDLDQVSDWIFEPFEECFYYVEVAE
jgi:hypothetical protein